MKTVWDDLRVEREWIVSGGREKGYKKMWRNTSGVFLRFGNPESGQIARVTKIVPILGNYSLQNGGVEGRELSFDSRIPEGVYCYHLYAHNPLEGKLRVREVVSARHLERVASDERNYFKR